MEDLLIILGFYGFAVCWLAGVCIFRAMFKDCERGAYFHALKEWGVLK